MSPVSLFVVPDDGVVSFFPCGRFWPLNFMLAGSRNLLSVMAMLDENVDVDKLLASIHLEKYLEVFRQSGFLQAKDFIDLNNENLNQLGITATGHRKRILKVAEQIRRQRQELPLDRCQSESAIHLALPRALGGSGPPSPQNGVPVSRGHHRNSSVPNLPSAISNSEPEQGGALVKPVPKPRTVFHKPRTESLLSCSAPESRLSQGLSQESLCFTVLEGIAHGEPVSDSVDAGSGPRTGPCERRLSDCLESGGDLPPVPPRLNRGIPPATFRVLSSPGREEQDRFTPPSSSSCPGTPCTHMEPPFLPTASPPRCPLEMVSNEIYWGTVPSPEATRAEGHRNRPVPLPPPRQELNTSTERNRYGHHLPENSLYFPPRNRYSRILLEKTGVF